MMTMRIMFCFLITVGGEEKLIYRWMLYSVYCTFRVTYEKKKRQNGPYHYKSTDDLRKKKRYRIHMDMDTKINRAGNFV